ncbi:hypothetical protein MWH25_09860 [Natroniella acetigena]|uniref:hypothetical protein n=1 Tax=Natroniella acetigena TaxID=52004 RepID=UPI00200AB5CB|nr:hypothetical protein [Natroniella acetigena]MCK8828042.1 hypothetical protein [Natroniella acetigena]
MAIKNKEQKSKGIDFNRLLTLYINKALGEVEFYKIKKLFFLQELYFSSRNFRGAVELIAAQLYFLSTPGHINTTWTYLSRILLN